MKIELKRLTTSARLSQETTAFAADIWVDGKKAGSAENDGHGGATRVHLDRSVREVVEAHGKTLVPDQYRNHTSGTEWVVDQLVEAELRQREDKKFARRIASTDKKFVAKCAAHKFRAARFRSGTSWSWFAFKPDSDHRCVANEAAKKDGLQVDELVVLS